MLDPRLAVLRDRLAARPPRTTPTATASRASVALLVQPAPVELRVLLIERTVRAGDPWSGHMALPGGRWEPGDPDARATAVRETAEEVGIDLRAVGIPLGALDDIAPRTARFSLVVSPFVFGVPAGTLAHPSAEVAATVWIPVPALLDPATAAEYLHPIENGAPLRFPAFGYAGRTIWGLTHRILSQFLALATDLYGEG